MISFRGGNAGPGWEKARRRRHSLGGGTAGDSCVRVVSVDARPAGYVSLEPWHPSSQPPEQCPLRAPEKRPTSRVQRRDREPPGYLEAAHL